MERETGIEPATSSLGSWRSTAELLPLTAQSLRSLAALGISPAGSTPANRLNWGSWRSTAELLPPEDLLILAAGMLGASA